MFKSQCWRETMQASRWAAALACAAAVGCESGPNAHPFYAASYDAATGCLGAVLFVDVLEGPSPGDCKQVVCWLDTRGHAYVSETMCDGPPDWTRVEAPKAGSLCEAALVAWQQYGAGQCAPEAGADGADGAME